MRRNRRWASAGIVVVTAMAVLPASAGTADEVSAADRTLTVTPAADTAHSQVPLAPQLVIGHRVAASPWTLVWSDEFNGTALDTGKWNARDDAWVDYDLACITDRPRNVSVGGGLLTLRAQRERYACGGGTRAYTTAYLATDGGRASFKYGRFDMRAKSPTGPANSQGLWPAFWLRPDGGGRGEIDVVELPGGAKYHGAATAAIFYDYSPVKQDHRYALPASGHPADGFHRYTLDWNPKTIRWYVDGVQVWHRDRASTPWFDEVFHKAYHLRLNFQVGGWLGNPDSGTAFPAEFQVDWVRVYRHENAGDLQPQRPR